MVTSNDYSTVVVAIPTTMPVDVIIRRCEAESGAAVILADTGESFEKVAARRRNDERDERH